MYLNEQRQPENYAVPVVCKSVILKKHALELFQYSYALFDNRFELNSDLKAIVEITPPNISP